MNRPKKKKTSRQTRPCSGAKLKVESKNRHEPAEPHRSHDDLATESTITVPMAPIDVGEARKRIENLVTASFEKIANALIEAAAAGKLAEAKYLFEVVGLHPATNEAAFRPENSLAYRLLKKLGLPTEPVDRERDQLSRGEAGAEEQKFPTDLFPRRSDATVEGMP